MAKPLAVSDQGVTSSFQLSKIQCQKPCGSHSRIPVDAQGGTYTRASLTDDGAVLISAGMIAQGWFDLDALQQGVDRSCSSAN